jgi:hypothetical protein
VRHSFLLRFFPITNTAYTFHHGCRPGPGLGHLVRTWSLCYNHFGHRSRELIWSVS